MSSHLLQRKSRTASPDAPHPLPRPSQSLLTCILRPASRPSRGMAFGISLTIGNGGVKDGDETAACLTHPELQHVIDSAHNGNARITHAALVGLALSRRPDHHWKFKDAQ